MAQLQAMSVYVSAHLRDAAITIERSGSTQWLQIDDGALDIFASDAELTRLRDVISAHLDAQAGEPS